MTIKSVILLISSFWVLCSCKAQSKEIVDRTPNFLFVMGEDMSWKHFGAYGEKAIETPNFDRLSQEGVLFENAYCPAPTCGPSRASVLTGRPIYQLGMGASIYMPLPAEYGSYQENLENAGYQVGYAGKGWGPGEFDEFDRPRNAAGPRYDYNTGLSTKSEKRSYEDNFKNQESDYAANLDYFLTENRENKPFSFWVGTSDAHRGFDAGKYLEAGIDISKITVPDFFPDTEEVRKEIADYLFEVKRFDSTVGELIEVLKKRGAYENTVIVVTADHGWSFPRGKGSLYEYGMHVPLVINVPWIQNASHRSSEFVNLNEIAPTLLEMANVAKPAVMTTTGFGSLLKDTADNGSKEPPREAVVLAHERHSPYRKDGLGYPMRGIVNARYYYIENKKPERWPSGAPPHYADPSDEMIVRALIVDNKDGDYKNFFDLDYGLRPREELYDMSKDPYQLQNLAFSEEFKDVKEGLKEKLDTYLMETGDPRATSEETEWDTMPWIWRWKYPEYKPENQEELIEEFNKKYKKENK